MAGSNVTLYSTTAASNATVGSITWAEGQAPSTVNDSARLVLADIRSFVNVLASGWIEYGDSDGSYTATYVAATQFKFAGVDLTSVYHVGRRIRLVATTPGTIYGTITASAFATDTTLTISWDSGSLSNEAITSVMVSPVTVTNSNLPALAGTQITGLTAETSLATDDLFVISDTSESGAANKMTAANVAAGILAFAASAATDTAQGVLETATQAEQETGTAVDKIVTPGRQHFHLSALKAHGELDGTGTISLLASYNLDACTDNGTGDYTFNITTDFSSANYPGVGMVGNNAAGTTALMLIGPASAAQAAGTFRVLALNSSFAAADAERVSMHFAGDI